MGQVAATITNPGADRVRLRAMDNQKPTPDYLQQSLSKLHQELAGTPRVDDSSKRLLRDVLGDIERLLGTAPAAGNAAAAAEAAAPAEPASRLEALAVEFEAEHPSLSASLREFVDLLGRAGL
jgi:Domain of unknown function (DUF4404)